MSFTTAQRDFWVGIFSAASIKGMPLASGKSTSVCVGKRCLRATAEKGSCSQLVLTELRTAYILAFRLKACS